MSQENHDILDDDSLNQQPLTSWHKDLVKGKKAMLRSLLLAGTWSGYHMINMINGTDWETFKLHEDGTLWLSSPMMTSLLFGFAAAIAVLGSAQQKSATSTIDANKKAISALMIFLFIAGSAYTYHMTESFNEWYNNGLNNTNVGWTEAYEKWWRKGNTERLENERRRRE